MRVVYPKVNGKFTDLYNCRNAIFLAGPCPRNASQSDWRDRAIEYLKDTNVTILNPTNREYDNDFEAQTEWEWKALRLASVIVFWIPRTEENLALTTNIEFGEWMHSDNIVVGYPEGSMKNEYIGERLRAIGKTHYTTLEDTLEVAKNILYKDKSKLYFTSDTHFGQQRTLELSKRPFRDVKEMDYTLISNWNKRVTCNDVVIHAGDFGDIDNLDWYLSNLNFRALHWVLGNYDREQEEKIRGLVSNNYNIILHGILEYDLGHGKYLFIVHEPITEIELSDDVKEYTVLYGHIHGRTFAKKNGFDLACDYHHYAPISYDDVKWFMNASKYWDENVFCDKVNTVYR